MSSIKEYAEQLRATAITEPSKKDENKIKAKFDKQALMRPFKDEGLTEEDLKRYGRASANVARSMYGAMVDIATDEVKAKVKAKEDFRNVSVHGTGRVNKDLSFDGKVNAYKEGEMTTKDDSGNSVKKPWQSWGTGSVSVVVSGGGGNEDTQSSVDALKEAAKKSAHYTPLA